MANYFNVTKFRIFNLIERFGTSVSPADLVFNLKGMSRVNAWKRLSLMHLQGYLLRKSRGKYTLSAKGKRVFERLKERRDIQKATGAPVSLNLRKALSLAVTLEYNKKKQQSI